MCFAHKIIFEKFTFSSTIKFDLTNIHGFFSAAFLAKTFKLQNDTKNMYFDSQNQFQS